MAKKDLIENQEEGLKTIEEWKEEYKVPKHVFEGLKTLKDWGDGKSLTKNEFYSALKEFLKGV